MVETIGSAKQDSRGLTFRFRGNYERLIVCRKPPAVNTVLLVFALEMVLRLSTNPCQGWNTALQFREQATAYKQNFISYKRKRTISLIDEFNAATRSLDRILEKMDETDPADKERLEAYVKSMQVKVQQILKAILRVH